VVGGGDTGAVDDFVGEGVAEDPIVVDVGVPVAGDPEDPNDPEEPEDPDGPEVDFFGEVEDPVPSEGESRVGDGWSENDCTATAWSGALR
jgi:hypothetical protein